MATILESKSDTPISAPLNKAEQKILDCLSKDIECSLDGSEEETTVRAEFIFKLSAKNQSNRLTTKGISIHGAHITGMLDLSDMEIKFPLRLTGCKFDKKLHLNRTRVQFLSLEQSIFHKGISAELIHCDGDIILDYASASDTINFSRSFVAGIVSFNGAKLLVPEGYALILTAAHIKGTVFFRENFTAAGQVSLIAACVNGQICFYNANLTSSNGFCLSLDALEIGDSIFIDESKFDGPISIMGAKIGSQLLFDHVTIISQHYPITVAADSIHCKGAVKFSHCTIVGDISFIASELERALMFFNCKINAYNYALGLDGAKIKDKLMITNVEINGLVSLLSTDIGSQLAFRDCRLECQGQYSIVADDMKVGSQFLIDQNVYIGNRARLHGITVQGAMVVQNSVFASELDLRWAKVGEYIDDEESWPEKGNLLIDDFEYQSISPINVEVRKRWLERMLLIDGYSPQPYTQLAKVLRKQGYEEATTKILIERQKARIKHSDLTFLSKTWAHVMGIITGHGYRPARAIFFLIVLWLVGAAVFNINTDTMVYAEQASLDGSYTPQFQPLLYSIDTLLPIIELGVEKLWLPTGWMHYYNGVHKVLGWFLSTLSVVAITGFIRKE